MDDLKYAFMQGMQLKHDAEECPKMVLQYALKGSRARTPFWHASTNLTASHEWFAKAYLFGSQPSEGKRVAIRIDIWALHQPGEMLDNGLIDLSSTTAQDKVFGNSLKHLGVEQDEAAQAMQWPLGPGKSC